MPLTMNGVLSPMSAEKSNKEDSASLFAGNAGIHLGDCFEEPLLVRYGDAPVRIKKRAAPHTRTGTRRL